MGHKFTVKDRKKSHDSRRVNLEKKKLKQYENFLKNPDKERASSVLRESLIYSGREEVCGECNLYKWRGKPLVLDVDHIDGNRTNNRLKNLRFLCPNCHSQTDTFRGRNINSGRKKVSDEDLIKALKETNNIREALIKVKLAPKGGNYSRCYKLLEK